MAHLAKSKVSFSIAPRGLLDESCDSSDCASSSDYSDYETGKQVIVGICAMEKKSLSKPMKEILSRIEEFEYIKTIIFSEQVILKEPVEKWPLCDCLIAFHSDGFPLSKAIEYKNLRQPYIINDLEMQFDIQDRCIVYNIMESAGIEIPRYAILDRDSDDPTKNTLIEYDDHVEVNGVIFNKPFVEKPISAEDHNVYMYYPASAGGGSQRLFRKIGSRSSVYSSESSVRKTGSYIYEDFMPTDGTDVKVYTVGPDYAHAEARKSPALDGKVERDATGKEVRYPVILSNREKLIARKVCMAFKQTVCGFDLLRANGKSIVCDVNGFSFVKNSSKYYDDSAKILGNMILRELAPTLHIPWTMPFQLDDPPIVPTTVGKMMELRCVVAVIRHGDRTPKQKMKLEVKHPKFFAIFEKYDGFKKSNIKLKQPKQLQEILDVARELLEIIQHGSKESRLMIHEKKSKLEQIKNVLEMYGHFSGINRKVQLKYQPKGRPRHSSSDEDPPHEASLLLILKWGGELTPSGRKQAEELGKVFRCMYPGGQGEYAGTQGLGLLRLHSTYRHDLKIYASDEGRVQMTAAAFAKGLLALEGELTPILVQMVKSANTNGLLDNDNDCSSKYQNIVKAKLFEMMQMDREFSQEDEEHLNPTHQISIANALKFIKNPVRCCRHILHLIKELNRSFDEKGQQHDIKELYHGETWELMLRRWSKLEKDFKSKNGIFDISKIPDIYDCIKYDLLHNRSILLIDQAEELYTYAKSMADVVIPQEYGMTRAEKLTIAQGICAPLLRKVRADLQRNIEEHEEDSDEYVVNRLNPRYSSGVSSPGRHVRTRLYFTSESHIHSLLTILSEGGLVDSKDEQWQRAMEYVSLVSELNYMTQVVIMLYEDPTKELTSDERFHVELHFSPGVNCCVQKDLPPGPGFRPHSRNNERATPIEVYSDNNSVLESGGGATSSDHTSLTDQSDAGASLFPDDLSTTPHMVCSIKCSSSDIENVFADLDNKSDKAAAVIEDVLLDESSAELPSTLRPDDDDDDGTNAIVNDGDDQDSDFGVQTPYRTSDPISISSPRHLSGEAAGGNAGGSFPGRGLTRSRSLEKRGSRPRSLESTTENQDSDSNIHRDPPSKSQSMDEVGDEEHLERGRMGFCLSRDRRCTNQILHHRDLRTHIESEAEVGPVADVASGPGTGGDDGVGKRHLAFSRVIPVSKACSLPSLQRLAQVCEEVEDKADLDLHVANTVTSAGPGTSSAVTPCLGSNLHLATPIPDCFAPTNECASLSALIVAPSTPDSFRRAHRHSIPVHRLNNYLKFLNELAANGSTTAHLFSTAVISGSSSVPNLKEMPHASEGIGLSVGMPNIRPLETLHNALSLRQLDVFLDFVLTTNFKTPCQSPSRVFRHEPSDFFKFHENTFTRSQAKCVPCELYKRIQQIQRIPAFASRDLTSETNDPGVTPSGPR